MFYFEIYKDKKKEFRWRLVCARNKKIVADSGEGYSRRASCRRAVGKVAKSTKIAHYSTIRNAA